MLFKTVDDKGQLSLEYILSALIAILVITLLSVPILTQTIDYSNDVMDSMNAKNELSKITGAIDFCYNSGKGSKKTVFIDLNRDSTIRFSQNGQNGIAYLRLNLSDGSSKEISDSYDYNKLNANIQLSNGFNRIVVKWDDDTGLISISKAS